MIHLRSFRLKRLPALPDRYPFSLPLIRALDEVSLSAPVTFFVGENGSGKSTILEALATAAGSITVGSESVSRDESLASVRQLGERLQLTWRARTGKGFFLRAEDFFGYARRLARMREELAADMARVDDEYEGRSLLARQLARMPYARELADMERRFGEGLDNFSHGESFLELFQSRFVPGGLYLLDEPEAPLSPLRQLAFLSLLKETVEQDAQFIIATHSPILLAFPGAQILNFDQIPLQPVAYEALEHVRLTRDFLANPEAFLRHL